MTNPAVEILDLAYLRQQTAGDETLERELLGLLLGQCDAFRPILMNPVDTPARRDAAHSLRGAAAGLGANRLAAAAMAIEAGEASAAGIGRALDELGRTVERLLRPKAA